MCSYYMLSRAHRKLDRIPPCRFVKAAKYLKRKRPDDEDTRASGLRTLIVILNASADQAERMNHDDNEDKLRKRARARLKKLRSILRRKGLPAPNLKRLGFAPGESLGDAVGDFFGDLGAAAEDMSPMTKSLGALFSIGALVWLVTKK